MTIKNLKNDINLLTQPFVKWAGGKRQLLPSIAENLPKYKYNNYYEPFIGGGALLFELQPNSATINDFNSDLINVYKTIKNDVNSLIDDLKKHKNNEEYYYEVRKMDRSEDYAQMSNIEKASRFLYLNKTCYNGLFRVNSKNQFNVPFGKYKNPNIVNAEVLRSVSSYLNSSDIKILNGDYERAIKDCKKGDFVYFDPPYDSEDNKQPSFVGYTLKGFDRPEQKRLSEVYKELNERGCFVLLSNAKTQYIQELYAEFNIVTVRANRNINSNANRRGKVDEVLVRNYEI